MKRLIVILPLLLSLLLGALFLWSLRAERDPNALVSQLIDKPLPSFSAQPLPADLSQELLGQELVAFSSDSLNDGQVKLVNFYASWCAGCITEHPYLMELSQKTDLPIYGMAYKDEPRDNLRFLAGRGNPYQAVTQDSSGLVAIDFGLYGVPETYVIDKQGRVRYRFAKPLDPESLNTILLPMIAKLRTEEQTK